jgi:hypothetical protein
MGFVFARPAGVLFFGFRGGMHRSPWQRAVPAGEPTYAKYGRVQVNEGLTDSEISTFWSVLGEVPAVIHKGGLLGRFF